MIKRVSSSEGSTNGLSKKILTIFIIINMIIINIITFGAVVPPEDLPLRFEETHPRDRAASSVFKMMWDNYLEDDVAYSEYEYWSMHYSDTYNYCEIIGTNVKPFVYDLASSTGIGVNVDASYPLELRQYKRILVYKPDSSNVEQITTNTWTTTGTKLINPSLEFSKEYYYNYDVYTLDGTFIKEGFDVYEEISTSENDDIISYTNNTGDFIRVELFSVGNSNVTILEPTRLNYNGDITTSQISFTLAPAETITITRNTGDEIKLRIIQDSDLTPIQQPTEYVTFSQPIKGMKTVNKFVIAWATYKILADEVDDVNIQITNNYFSTNNRYELKNDPNLAEYRIFNHKQYDRGDYVEGFVEYEMIFKDSYVGNVDTELYVWSDTSAQINSTEFEIVAFIDSNADGKDDNTGQDAYEKIEFSDFEFDNTITPENYSDDIFGRIKYGFDKLFEIILMPFKFIADAIETIIEWFDTSLTWITQINKFIGQFMAFIPTEIMSAITVLVFCIVIFSIFKLMR